MFHHNYKHSIHNQSLLHRIKCAFLRFFKKLFFRSKHSRHKEIASNSEPQLSDNSREFQLGYTGSVKSSDTSSESDSNALPSFLKDSIKISRQITHDIPDSNPSSILPSDSSLDVSEDNFKSAASVTSETNKLGGVPVSSSTSIKPSYSKPTNSTIRVNYISQNSTVVGVKNIDGPQGVVIPNITNHWGTAIPSGFMLRDNQDVTASFGNKLRIYNFNVVGKPMKHTVRIPAQFISCASNSVTSDVGINVKGLNGDSIANPIPNPVPKYTGMISSGYSLICYQDGYAWVNTSGSDVKAPTAKYYKFGSMASSLLNNISSLSQSANQISANTTNVNTVTSSAVLDTVRHVSLVAPTVDYLTKLGSYLSISPSAATNTYDVDTITSNAADLSNQELSMTSDETSIYSEMSDNYSNATSLTSDIFYNTLSSGANVDPDRSNTISEYQQVSNYSKNTSSLYSKIESDAKRTSQILATLHKYQHNFANHNSNLMNTATKYNSKVNSMVSSNVKDIYNSNLAFNSLNSTRKENTSYVSKYLNDISNNNASFLSNVCGVKDNVKHLNSSQNSSAANSLASAANSYGDKFINDNSMASITISNFNNLNSQTNNFASMFNSNYSSATSIAKTIPSYMSDLAIDSLISNTDAIKGLNNNLALDPHIIMNSMSIDNVKLSTAASIIKDDVSSASNINSASKHIPSSVSTKQPYFDNDLIQFINHLNISNLTLSMDTKTIKSCITWIHNLNSVSPMALQKLHNQIVLLVSDNQTVQNTADHLMSCVHEISEYQKSINSYWSNINDSSSHKDINSSSHIQKLNSKITDLSKQVKSDYNLINSIYNSSF